MNILNTPEEEERKKCKGQYVFTRHKQAAVSDTQKPKHAFDGKQRKKTIKTN